MSKLMDSFRSQMLSGKKGFENAEATGDVMYSTGFANLDYLNGYKVHIKNKNVDEHYTMVGVPDGASIQLIGRSHSGKSSLAIQIASNIIRPFPNACIYHDDIEGGANDHRYEALSGFSQKRLEDCYSYRNTHITVEGFYERIKSIHDIKINDRDSYLYDTGYYNYKGEKIFKFEPTVYILDSIPGLMPKDILESDELGGQMGATSIAKSNTAIFKRIPQLCKDANIILITINHILEDVQINAFVHKKTTLPGLKQGERLPGGRTVQYLTNTEFRVDDGKKLKPDSDYGVDGSIVELQTVKSRTNASLKTVPMVFIKNSGFNNFLSLFELLKVNNKVNGSGSYLYLGTRNDIKFSQRNFLEKIHQSPDLQMELIKEAIPILESYVAPEANLVKQEETIDINKMILDAINGKEVHPMITESIESKNDEKKSNKSLKDIVEEGDITDVLGPDLQDTTDNK